MEHVVKISIADAKLILDLFDFNDVESMQMIFTSYEKVRNINNYYVGISSEHRVYSKPGYKPSIDDLNIKFNDIDCELKLIEIYYKDSDKYFIFDLEKRSITFYGMDAPITMKQIREKIGHSFFREINAHY